MAEYIEREEVLAILRKNPTGTWRGVPVYSDDIKSAIRGVETLPAADVEPVAHGRWIDDCQKGPICSACGKKVWAWTNGREPPHCPSCGAKMEEAR